MHNISNDLHRATRDLDLDFIKYSLNDKSIKNFIDKLNNKEGLSINIVGRITELKHQDYRLKKSYLKYKSPNLWDE